MCFVLTIDLDESQPQLIVSFHIGGAPPGNPAHEEDTRHGIVMENWGVIAIRVFGYRPPICVPDFDSREQGVGGIADLRREIFFQRNRLTVAHPDPDEPAKFADRVGALAHLADHGTIRPLGEDRH